MNKYVIHWKFIGPSGPQLLGQGAPLDCPAHNKMREYMMHVNLQGFYRRGLLAVARCV